MGQLGLVRIVMNFGFGLLSNLRTVIWIALMALIIGYGYLVFANGFNFGSAMDDITGHVTNIWDWARGVIAGIRSVSN